MRGLAVYAVLWALYSGAKSVTLSVQGRSFATLYLAFFLVSSLIAWVAVNRGWPA